MKKNRLMIIASKRIIIWPWELSSMKTIEVFEVWPLYNPSLRVFYQQIAIFWWVNKMMISELNYKTFSIFRKNIFLERFFCAHDNLRPQIKFCCVTVTECMYCMITFSPPGYWMHFHLVPDGSLVVTSPIIKTSIRLVYFRVIMCTKSMTTSHKKY